MMAGIDRTSAVPIYHQLKSLIRSRIENGHWRPGDRLPTEHEFCELYGISRAPVRQALSELAQDGLLRRRAGLGTFVSERAAQLAVPEASIEVMTSDPSWPRVLGHVARAWNLERANPPVAIDVSVVDHGQFYSLLSSAVGRGSAPDIAMVDCVWVGGLARAGFLYALEEVGSSFNRAKFEQDLFPAFVDANSYGGRLYGLPVKADAAVLWFRRDWFEAEGLAPPRDWDTLIEACLHFGQPAVRDRLGLAYPLAFPGGVAGGEATVYNLLPFIWSAGGDVVKGGVTVLDSPETCRALEFLRELVTVHAASPPDVVDFRWDTSPWALASGRAAMALGGSYQRDIILDVSGWGRRGYGEHVGCVAPPPASQSDPVPTVGGTSYVILRQCQRPGLVMDVLQMATEPNYVGNLFRSMLQNSPRPSFGAFLDAETDVFLDHVSRLVVSGRARPSLAEYHLVSRRLQDMFERSLSTQEPVSELVQSAHEFIRVVTARPITPS
jgi:ABC-type glycerol-3-phosphate transport system substrate-binding protein